MYLRYGTLLGTLGTYDIYAIDNMNAISTCLIRKEKEMMGF